MAQRRTRQIHTRSMVTVPFPVEVGERLAKAAHISERKLATFIREAAVEKAERILARHRRDTAAASAA